MALGNAANFKSRLLGDRLLNGTEKAAGNVMMTCVSRAKSARLVLDI